MAQFPAFMNEKCWPFAIRKPKSRREKKPSTNLPQTTFGGFIISGDSKIPLVTLSICIFAMNEAAAAHSVSEGHLSRFIACYVVVFQWREAKWPDPQNGRIGQRSEKQYAKQTFSVCSNRPDISIIFGGQFQNVFLLLIVRLCAIWRFDFRSDSLWIMNWIE